MDGATPRKIGALGLRVERGVTYHGIALNVTVDLADFDLIDPCGMPGLVSTSIAEELGRTAEPPSTAAVERHLIEADASRKRRAEVVDRMAAAYILQGALDRLRNLADR